MKIRSMYMGIVIFIIILGGIGITKGIDLWTTTSNKIPAKIKEGEFEGSYNPADIRGSYTFADVSELFEIELPILYQAFDIPADTNGDAVQVKELETLFEDSGYEIGTETLRIFVALYNNLPVDLDESYMPKKATELILKENENLTEEQKEYLNLYTVDIEPLKQTSQITLEESASGTKSNESEESESTINGSSTFQQVLDAGVTKEQIEEVLQASMPPTNQKVKDYCVEAGLKFSDVKNQLNEFVEAQ